MTLLGRPISQQDRQRARWHLLDWYACARHGARDVQGVRWGRAFAQQAESYTPTGADALESFCILPELVHPDFALRYNAAVGNIGEMDDVHRQSVLHPGPIVVPVALATSLVRDRQLKRADGSASGDSAGEGLRTIGAATNYVTVNHLLDAIIRGYETTIRVGEALGLAHYRYYHSTATAGVFGSASAAASVLGLDDLQWTWALGNAGSVAGGLWQLRNETVNTKQWHNAHAAATGQQAALLAASGVTGPLEILEGPQGLLAATAEGGHVEAVTAGEADPWKLHDCSFKPWPACRHAHPVIDAALGLREQLQGRDIARVQIDTYTDAVTFCDRPLPENVGDARFSLQYTAAVALLHGAPTLADFEDDAWSREPLADLMKHVEVVSDGTFTDAYPDRFGARVTVWLADSGALPLVAEVRDTLGDPSRPLERAAHLAKLQMLLEITDTDVTERWANSLLGLDGEAPARSLMTALQTQGPHS
ncbi:MAG: MmgE/PrpD family protein [Pseudomonadota bacterium]